MMVKQGVDGDLILPSRKPHLAVALPFTEAARALRAVGRHVPNQIRTAVATTAIAAATNEPISSTYRGGLAITARHCVPIDPSPCLGIVGKWASHALVADNDVANAIGFIDGVAR